MTNPSTNRLDLKRIAGHRPWTDAEYTDATRAVWISYAMAVGLSLLIPVAVFTIARGTDVQIALGITVPIIIAIVLLAIILYPIHEWRMPLDRGGLARLELAIRRHQDMHWRVAAWVNAGLTLRRRDLVTVEHAAKQRETNEAYQALGSASDSSEGKG